MGALAVGHQLINETLCIRGEEPLRADIQNYVGYAYRRMRQLGPAMQHYQKALMLNRRHRRAHEHAIR